VATKAIDLCFKLSNSLTSVVILWVAKGDRALVYLPVIVNRLYGLKCVTDRLYSRNRTDTVHKVRYVNQLKPVGRVMGMQSRSIVQ